MTRNDLDKIYSLLKDKAVNLRHNGYLLISSKGFVGFIDKEDNDTKRD